MSEKKKANPFGKKEEVEKEEQEAVELLEDALEEDHTIIDEGEEVREGASIEERVKILEDWVKEAKHPVDPADHPRDSTYHDFKKELESHESFDELETSEMFTALENRVVDERAKVIIGKAKEEWNALTARTSEENARELLGNILRDQISGKLMAARAVEGGAVGGN